jgi:type II secretory pathway pseudopilin PulG
MQENHKKAHVWGFPFFEIVIVAIIVVIIVGFIIPEFSKIQKKAKHAEAKEILLQIAEAEEVYFQEHGVYLYMEPTPRGYPGKEVRPWPNGRPDSFDELGFSPKVKDVYGQYAVNVDEWGFTIVARFDVDGDGRFSHYAFVSLGSDLFVADYFEACVTLTGDYDRSVFTLGEVFPCTSEDGETVF